MTGSTTHNRVDPQGRRQRPLKRAGEALLIALPALLVIAGGLSGAIEAGLVTWLIVVGILGLAAGVLTQHWIAYTAVLVTGVAFALSSGMLALAAWVCGAIYLAVSLPNLVGAVIRRRTEATRNSAELPHASSQ